MDKKLLNLKTITDENLIKLWVYRYKKYAEVPDIKTLNKKEIQDIYDEGRRRGLENTLVQLYNAIYFIHITARNDINTGVLKLWAFFGMYPKEYELFNQLAQLYSLSNLKPTDDKEEKYLDKIAEHLLKQLPLNYSDSDEPTIGEETLEHIIINLKGSLLYCSKTQERVNRDITTDEAKEQIKSTRQIISVFLGELSDHIGFLRYELGLPLRDGSINENPNKGFYQLIEKNIGVAKFGKRMEKLEGIIERQLTTDSRRAEIKRLLKEEMTKPASLFNFPIEVEGVPKEKLIEINKTIEELFNRKKLL